MKCRIYHKIEFVVFLVIKYGETKGKQIKVDYLILLQDKEKNILSYLI